MRSASTAEDPVAPEPTNGAVALLCAANSVGAPAAAASTNTNSQASSVPPQQPAAAAVPAPETAGATAQSASTDGPLNVAAASTVAAILPLSAMQARHERARAQALSSVIRKMPPPALEAEAAAVVRQVQGKPAAAPTGPKKRGRPRGSVDKRPRKQYKKREPKPAPHPVPNRRFANAEKTLSIARQRCKDAQTDIEKAEAAVETSKKKLAAAKRAKKSADAAYRCSMERFADKFLEEPTAWNQKYKMLAEFKEKEGHVNIKMSHAQAVVVQEGDAEAEAYQKKLKAIVSWTKKQRLAKHAGKLELYQEVLMERLGFNWNPPRGQDGSKWQAQFEELQEFKRVHGHVNVPSTQVKLANWIQTQRTQYRNGLHNKTPALKEERRVLLENIGFDWGEERVVIPWEDRFEELKRYKEQYGHANVPWRWSENLPLANWVNSQRCKYKDLTDGKKTNLTTEQIAKLESVGLDWNTGGTGRYAR